MGRFDCVGIISFDIIDLKDNFIIEQNFAQIYAFLFLPCIETFNESDLTAIAILKEYDLIHFSLIHK